MPRMRSTLGVSIGLVAALAAGSAVLGGAAALLVPVGHELSSGAARVTLPKPVLRTLAARSVVYDADGVQMAVLHGGQNRAPIALRDVDQTLVDAVLAAEDRNFYEHNGVDWRGIGRALATNLDAGAVREGGSTISQQLVKNTMFDDPKRDLDRKVKEAVLAIALEQHYSKDAILESYLNTIYLGNGAYGVRAAAERYFDKEPSELNIAEAALIAALIANPEGRDPVRHPDEAARSRHTVLEAMAAAGTATPEELTLARGAPLPAKLTPIAVDPINDPFVEEVKRSLLRDERLGISYQERYRRVFEGGLRIYTTYDTRLQYAAELAVRKVLPSGTPYTATLVAIENETGAVRAMVPGTSTAHAGFNLATQGTRQTGSAFKAITLTAAIEAGYSPDDRVNASGQCTFDFDDRAPEWKVRNYDGHSQGNVTLKQAIAKSSNCAFARVALSLGADKIVDMAHRLGIERDLEAVPSITLGSQAVSPLDMAAAFSTLANEGMQRPPRFLDRVETADGEVLFDERPDAERVIDSEVARTVTSMLEEVIESGTGTRADLGRPAAGKTGTNQEYRDAWFVGYTPQLTASVWIGNPDAQVPITIEGTRVTGGSYPARIWHDFMIAALQDEPVAEFVAPNEELWPRGASISEDGRKVSSRPRSTSSTAGPGTADSTVPTETAPTNSTDPTVPAPALPATPALPAPPATPAVP